MELFFLPDIQETKTVELTPEESRHCVKVLRHKAGDTIQLVDGKGGLYSGIVRHADAKNCKVEIVYRLDNFSGRDYSVHMAVAPTKNIDRFEWFCEKATEVGVNRITPLICEHSERRVVKTERIEKIMISALKQSVKAWLPRIDEPMNFTDFIKTGFEPSQLFICTSTAEPGDSLSKFYVKKTDAVIMVGPEGDFSPRELEMAVENKFKAVNLGGSRLRTETAALVSCFTINLLNTLED